MTFNKWKLIVLLALSLAAVLAVGISAEELTCFYADELYCEMPSIESETLYAASSSDKIYGLDRETALELADRIYTAQKNVEPTLDIYDLGISSSLWDGVGDLWRAVSVLHRDLEWYDKSLGASAYGGVLSTLKFTYSYDGLTGSSVDPEYIKEIRAEIDDEIDEMIARMEPGMSELEQMLFVHDQLCLMGTYDNRLYGGNIPRSSFDVRGILLTGTGVCQSYTWTYQLIMEKLGITCISAASDTMNHTWNQVLLDGQWYNIDITWDDNDSRFRDVRHDHFLCSDEHFVNDKGYKDYYSEITELVAYDVSCSSDKYDDEFWADVGTYMPYVDGLFYYIESEIFSSVNRVDLDTGEIEELYKVNSFWYSTNGQAFDGNFTRLDYFDERIYFNTPKQILSMETDGSDVRVIETFSSMPKAYAVYGIEIKDGVLYYVQDYTPNKDFVTASGSIEIAVDTRISMISVTPADAVMNKGGELILNVSVNSSADPSRIIWSTSDENVATVSGGTVTAKGVGSAVISATSPDYPSLKASVTITVQGIVNVIITSEPPVMEVGDVITLDFTVNKYGDASKLIWSTSNNCIATVVGGKVTAIAEGTAVISATSPDDPNVKASVTVSVVDEGPHETTSITFGANATHLYTDTTLYVRFTLNKGALRADLIWSVDNSLVLSVEDGVVRVLGVGTATVTVTSRSNPAVSASLTFTVDDGEMGDISGDDEVNARDAVIVAQILSGWNVSYSSPDIADLDGNGIVDAKDAVRLAQYLAGWQVDIKLFK